MKNLFVRVYYDLDSIKESTIWKMALVDEVGHMLYIETMHDHLSEHLSKKRFEELSAQSYFRGLINVDEKIAKLELSDAINNTSNSEINIFIKSDPETRDKIKQFINEYFPNEKEINIVFKNAFEEVLFMDYIEDILSDIHIETLDINCHIVDPTDNYAKVCKASMKKSLKDLKDNEEMSQLLKYLQIIIEDLLLKDLFMYINKKK